MKKNNDEVRKIMEDFMSLYEFLPTSWKIRMKFLGKKQNELSKHCKISQPTVSLILSNAKKTSLDDFYNIEFFIQEAENNHQSTKNSNLQEMYGLISCPREDFFNKFRDIIYDFLVYNNISQAHFCKIANITEACLSHIINKKTFPRKMTVEKILLGINIFKAEKKDSNDKKETDDENIEEDGTSNA